jgi:putative endonuclease
LNTRKRGSLAEDAVTELYKKAGYEVVERNWHFHRIGEIDIILKKKDTIVFTEVKSRKQGSMTTPAEAVNAKKKGTIKTLAKAYFSEYLSKGDNVSDYVVRFDVAEVTETEKKYIINVIKNAF